MTKSKEHNLATRIMYLIDGDLIDSIPTDQFLYLADEVEKMLLQAALEAKLSDESDQV